VTAVSRGAPLIALLSGMLVACSGSPSAPTAEGSPPIGEPPTFVLTTLELRGRIVDDLNTPVAGAVVTVQSTVAADPSAPAHATTDGSGAFAFTATVRSTEVVGEASVKIDREGYEGGWTSILANADTTITVYPTMTIHAGSTLRARVVAAATYTCGSDGYRCRRIVVEPAGAPVVVEILGIDGEDVGLVDDESFETPTDHQRSVRTSDGDLFLIGGPATVTLRAHPPGASTDSLVGRYTLTLTHGCTEVPEAARTRTYTASIEPAVSGFVVTLSDAQFLQGDVCTMAESRLGCHQFLASRQGDNVRFDLTNADEWHGGYITEHIPTDTWLQVYGSAVGRLNGGAITASGSGGVWYCPTSIRNGCNAARYCEATDLRLTFNRR